MDAEGYYYGTQAYWSLQTLMLKDLDITWTLRDITMGLKLTGRYRH